MIRFLGLAIAVLSGLQAHAQSVRILNNCELEGIVRLDSDTVISCPNTLRVAAGAQIVTEGYRLRLSADGILDIADSLKIRAHDENPSGDNVHDMRIDSAEVAISARACLGNLDIDNRPSQESGLSGDIRIECLTTLNYDHTIQQGYAGSVTFVRNGDQEALVGVLYKPAL